MPAKQRHMIRLRSDLEVIDKEGNVYKNSVIWTDCAPAVDANPSLKYAKCITLPGSKREVFRCRQIEPPDSTNQEFDVPSTRSLNVNPPHPDPMTLHDIGMLTHKNEAAVLDFLRQRYVQGQIYTDATPLLVAINPFKDLKNATEAVIKQYREAPDLDRLPPHVFAIARQALENLHGVNKSQTIIVSGESGAGKTEATKQVMRYFASGRHGKGDARIQEAVLAANPVLEAFGNAKTLRNNNSSRFGRFMMLQVAPGGGIEYGTVRNFLLEKSRILTQESQERSYHIFYQLLKGSTSDQKQKYKLRGLTDYKYINPHCSSAPGIDDIEEWHDVQKSLDSMKLNAQEKDAIFSIVSGVLLLGNVDLVSVVKEGVHDAAEIDPKSRDDFNLACSLLSLEPAKVEEGLVVRIRVAGGNQIRGVYERKDSLMLKDSLAKAMYDKLFDWIIKKLNKTIEPPEFRQFMGMLDIFGFEVFKNNSLEQLFINITNEMLQKNFTDAVFDRETKLYREEGISAADLVWTTNDDVIQALTAPKLSVMAVLEDQCISPSPTDEKFVAACHARLKDNCKLKKAKLGSNINFAIEHTIGEIPYNATGFLFKNQDVLKAELVEIIQESPNEVCRGMFEGITIERGKLGKDRLIGSQFLKQLSEMMGIINSTEPHFIRCVKPNEEKAPLVFTPARVLDQLYALSILEALQLRNLGYAYRRPFKEFLYQYRFVNLGIAEDTTLNSKDAAEKLLSKAGIKSGWQIGKTMVFMKPNTVKEIARKQREALAAWKPLVVRLECLGLKSILRKQYKPRRAAVVRVQAYCRRAVSGRVPAPDFRKKVSTWNS